MLPALLRYRNVCAAAFSLLVTLLAPSDGRAVVQDLGGAPPTGSVQAPDPSSSLPKPPPPPSSPTPAPAPGLINKPTLINNPLVNGIAVDRCNAFAAECGQPAADYYCGLEEFGRAASFSISRAQTTQNARSGTTCGLPNICDALISVQCTAPMDTALYVSYDASSLPGTTIFEDPYETSNEPNANCAGGQFIAVNCANNFNTALVDFIDGTQFPNSGFVSRLIISVIGTQEVDQTAAWKAIYYRLVLPTPASAINVLNMAPITDNSDLVKLSTAVGFAFLGKLLNLPIGLIYTTFFIGTPSAGDTALGKLSQNRLLKLQNVPAPYIVYDGGFKPTGRAKNKAPTIVVDFSLSLSVVKNLLVQHGASIYVGNGGVELVLERLTLR